MLEKGGWMAELKRFEIGSQDAMVFFLTTLLRDTLIFFKGSSIFVRNLAQVLQGMTHLVMAIDLGNRVTNCNYIQN
jgi:hypothetical protein